MPSVTLALELVTVLPAASWTVTTGWVGHDAWGPLLGEGELGGGADGDVEGRTGGRGEGPVGGGQRVAGADLVDREATECGQAAGAGHGLGAGERPPGPGVVADGKSHTARVVGGHVV